MTRDCDYCGEPLENPSVKKKYCNSSCRARYSDAKEPAPKPEDMPAPKATRETFDLVDAVRAELEAAERVNSYAGQHALELAQRITSAPGMNTGVAALSKRLDEVLANALRTSSAVANPLDELRARRDGKRRRAG